MNDKKWFSTNERPLKVGDFVVVAINDSNYTPRNAGIVITPHALVTLDGLKIPTGSVTQYKFVNFGQTVIFN